MMTKLYPVGTAASRISHDPRVMGGKPCIAGTRITVEIILRRFAERYTINEVLADYPTIQEVIDARVRTFDEFLILLDKSQRFRDWIQGVNPDAKLPAEYVREIAAEGWMASVPAKMMRYALTSALGIAAPIAGLAAGAVDSFLLDRIIGGWRPSHFVEGTLKPFLREKQ